MWGLDFKVMLWGHSVSLFGVYACIIQIQSQLCYAIHFKIMLPDDVVAVSLAPGALISETRLTLNLVWDRESSPGLAGLRVAKSFVSLLRCD